MTLVQEATRIIECMPRRNQQIVLELLRVMNNRPAANEKPEKNPDEKTRTAALGLAGLWGSHENQLPVDEVVRNMRKGRRFDY